MGNLSASGFVLALVVLAPQGGEAVRPVTPRMRLDE
jgi:hypothetical protein